MEGASLMGKEAGEGKTPRRVNIGQKTPEKRHIRRLYSDFTGYCLMGNRSMSPGDLQREGKTPGN